MSEITVAGLRRRDGVTRSSFYEHYGTKSGLLDQIFTDMMATIPAARGCQETFSTLDWHVDHVAAAPACVARTNGGPTWLGIAAAFPQGLDPATLDRNE